MHIPDSVLSVPVAAATTIVGAAGFAFGLKKLEGTMGERTPVLMGMMAAFVFAAQMINFLVLPKVSGHLLGGVLAAVLLGPWAGSVVIGVVLVVQCLLFADGGVSALGANFINMGLIGALGGHAIYAPIRRALGGRGGVLIGAMAAAWFAVILASGAFAIELAASGRWRDFPAILGWMALVHAAIGLGEALITGLVLRFLLLTRPDLIPDVDGPTAARRWGQAALGGLGIALAVAVFLAPLASDRPDGLEYVGMKLGFIKEAAGPVVAAPLADYQLPGLGRAPALATATAGGAGTLIVFAAGIVLARAVTRPLPKRIGPDAA